MRKVKIQRKTNETEIKLELDLDNVDIESGSEISSGIAFFDHMLNQLSKHSGIKISLDCKGDLEIDYHHTVEDVGICLGQGLKEALGDKIGINRYGHFALPMEESLTEVALDLSNRGYLVYKSRFKAEKIGSFDVELIKEFFRALSSNGGITLHINVRYGENSHHIAEGIFKCVGHALKMACREDPNIKGVLSTKGLI